MTHYKTPVAEYVYTEFFKEMEVDQDVYSTFSDKKNNTDKFLYVYGLLKHYNWLPKKIDGLIKLSQAHRRWRKRLKKSLKKIDILINMDCSTAIKNNKMSDQYRTSGNEEFKIKNYEESLKLYTLSILTADIDSSNFALAMANRSAALYYLKEYKHCLKDIDRTLISKKYPLENKYKLLERKGNCYRYMNHQSLALEIYSACLLHLNYAQLSLIEKEKTKMRISECIKKCEEIQTSTRKVQVKCISFSEHKINNNSVLSTLVEIKYSEEMGRGLFASKNIKPGEILIIEKPIGGVFKNNIMLFNCNYCLKRCLSAIPCFKCSRVLYCDETCLQKAFNSYHNTECSLIYPIKEDPTIEPTHDLAMRCFLQLINEMSMNRYCSMVQKFNKLKINFDESGQYFIDTFYSIYALNGNETKRTVSNLFFMNCTASMMVSLLVLNDYNIPPNLLGIVGESLVHLLCVTNLNSYASVELPKYIGNVMFNRTMDFNSIGLILCPVFSLLNHSCDPNVVIQTYNGIEVTRAIQPISKGTQLFTDYGVNFMTYKKEERYKYLMDHYQFHCKCHACSKKWPVYTLLELNELYISYPSNVHEELGVPKIAITRFNEIVHLLLTQSEMKVDYLDFLFSFLDLLYSNYKKPCKIYYNCIQVIQKLYYTSDQLHFVVE